MDQQEEESDESLLCEFFKIGHCPAGSKCKFSHDLNFQRKGEKIEVSCDKLDDDTMANSGQESQKMGLLEEEFENVAIDDGLSEKVKTWTPMTTEFTEDREAGLPVDVGGEKEAAPELEEIRNSVEGTLDLSESNLNQDGPRQSNAMEAFNGFHPASIFFVIPVIDFPDFTYSNQEAEQRTILLEVIYDGYDEVIDTPRVELQAQICLFFVRNFARATYRFFHVPPYDFPSYAFITFSSEAVVRSILQWFEIAGYFTIDRNRACVVVWPFDRVIYDHVVDGYALDIVVSH